MLNKRCVYVLVSFPKYFHFACIDQQPQQHQNLPCWADAVSISSTQIDF